MTEPYAQLDDGTVNLTKEQTNELVIGFVSEKRPAAVVRMGEGEGRLLAADPADDLSVRVAARKLRRQTGHLFPPQEVFKVRALLMRALDEADVLGLETSPSFADEHREWGERIADIYADRVALGREPAYVAHCLLNHNLYRILPELLAGQERIAVISCRDVEGVLKSDYDLSEVVTYRIPSQYAVRDVDGEYEEALHDVPIWPDFYRRLEADIEVRRRGEIFLIGAGLFGKALCIEVRERGGIGLDMGAMLDRLAGKVTRGPDKPPLRQPP